MSTITIRSESDIPPLVSRILGFVPTDSVVILGTGRAPTARVDLPTDPDGVVGLALGLGPAWDHWRSVPIIVAIYTDDVAAYDLAVSSVDVWLDGIEPAAVVHVPSDADHHAPTGSDYDAKHVVTSREALVAEAATIGDADLARRLAWESYSAGDGARAWIYLARVEALTGEPRDDDMTRLAHRLRLAVRPESV